MGSAQGWIKQHPGFLALIAAVVLGQVVQKLLQPSVERTSYGPNDFPLVPVVALLVALVLAIVVVWFRVQLGHELVGAARSTALSLPAPESLPARYAVADPPRQVVSGGLALLDLALVLLVQNTLRAPALVLAQRYVLREWAHTGFVALVLLATLLVLIKLYRAGGPMLVLLLWWALDRVVPTAGFLAAAPVATPTRPHSTVVTAPPASGDGASLRSRQGQSEGIVPSGGRPATADELAPTVVAATGAEPIPTVAAAPPAQQVEPTVVAGQRTGPAPRGVAPQGDGAELEATVVANGDELAGATVVSPHRQGDDDATDVAEEKP